MGVCRGPIYLGLQRPNIWGFAEAQHMGVCRGPTYVGLQSPNIWGFAEAQHIGGLQRHS